MFPPSSQTTEQMPEVATIAPRLNELSLAGNPRLTTAGLHGSLTGRPDIPFDYHLYVLVDGLPAFGIKSGNDIKCPITPDVILRWGDGDLAAGL
jgi:hypothetical protein